MTRSEKYKLYGLIFQGLTFLAAMSGFVFLFLLLISVFANGWEHLNWNFLTAYPSRFPEKAGILSAIVGTFWSMLLTAFVAIPMGIGAAIYLEEYAHRSRFLGIIKLNIQNLSGVPSIIYGILGLTVFVRFFGFGRSVLAGSLTMALLILPVITIGAMEGLRAVPVSLRHAGYGIGMTRWQVVKYNVLPVALPGVMTGIILALSRAIGEAAPLIMIGALTFVAFLPSSPMDSFTVLPIQIFNWSSRPQKGFHDISASAIIVLLAILIAMNLITILTRSYFRNKFKDINR